MKHQHLDEVAVQQKEFMDSRKGLLKTCDASEQLMDTLKSLVSELKHKCHNLAGRLVTTHRIDILDEGEPPSPKILVAVEPKTMVTPSHPTTSLITATPHSAREAQVPASPGGITIKPLPNLREDMDSHSLDRIFRSFVASLAGG